MKIRKPVGCCESDGESRGWQGGQVCNTLRAYGGHDFGPDISLRPLFTPGRSQGVRACRLSLPPARFAQLSCPKAATRNFREIPKFRTELWLGASETTNLLFSVCAQAAHS